MIRKIPSLFKTYFNQSFKTFAFTKKSNEPFAESKVEYTPKLEFVTTGKPIPTFRVIDLEGNLVSKENDPKDKDTLIKVFETMVRLEEMDTFLLMSQRQGKISFYMPSFGEAGCVIGSAAAMKNEDLIWAQYREQGALMWRGYNMQDFVNQCCGNIHDHTKGRQMPVHYSSKQHHWATVSSPLTTQLPQASGAGYGFRVQGLDKISATYFGEGAASEGDFHAALNFAATLQCQTLFLCRNNGYAISTPTIDQFRGDGIAGRGAGYGIHTLRVDGNDAIACYLATKAAREYIIKNKKPALIEFMTYRVPIISDHSTSDHSILYRAEEEIESWKAKNNPITRLGLFLKKKGWRDFNPEKDNELRKEYKKEVMEALKKGTNEQVHGHVELFTDVYDTLPPNLVEQRDELLDHLTRYGDKYKIGGN